MYKPKPPQVINTAQSAREQAMAIAMKRKEEYLGARVPRELKDKVIKKAEQIGIPVSILIRKVLEDAFGEDGYAIPGSPAEPSGQKVGDESAKDILGWKTIELNAGQRCCQCGKGLAKGGEAFIAITQAGQEEIKFYCGECKQDLQHR